MSFAAVLAAMPDLLARALAEHVPDERGHCRECRADDGTTTAWPCAMRLIADEARGMSGAEPPTAPVRTADPVPAVISDQWDPIADRRAFRRERFAN